MKNILLYKFLLPLSVAMLIVGAIILFSEPLFPDLILGPTPEIVYGGGLLFFFLGFVFFIVSLIDLFISRKRAMVAGQRTIPVQKLHSVLKYIGITVIVITLGFFVSLFLFFSSLF